MPQPTDIKLRTQSRLLEVRFDDGSHFELPFEYLRVFSPSAEVKGHGGGEGVLQTGKQDVGITGVEGYGFQQSFQHGMQTSRADILGAFIDLEGNFREPLYTGAGKF